MANPTYAATYKWPTVCPYYYNYPFGCGLPFVGININSWNKIPADIQQMFADLQDEAVRFAYNVYTGRGKKVLADGKASGKIKITEPTSEDAAYIKKVAQEHVWKEWVDNMNKKGLPGQKVLDAYSALLDKWEAKDPFK
jgi:TRAP-type C4-dicarboxylate transport system substrate-binding protein